MSKYVPYLTEEAIERDAEELLAEYATARNVIVAVPIPIEDIIEKHLKLGIEFDDVHKLFGVKRYRNDPDILGAMFFSEGRIVIDESLDPELNRSREGRYRFTLAHEGGGHWRLHRHLFLKDSAQAALFGGQDRPAVVCRTSQAKERVEWQADFYASCLLMPKRQVLARCDTKRFGNLTNEQLMDFVVRPMADEFKVSVTAMKIRLEYLGLSFDEGEARLDIDEYEPDIDGMESDLDEELSAEAQA